MKVTLLGGTETVTGSKFLVDSGRTRVLVDCGLFQGYKWLRRRNWQTLPLDREDLAGVVLTHAHLDHSGYLPALYAQGYRGPVYAHHATAALCAVLWPDAGHLQEEDAKYLARHKLSRHASPQPLYDRAAAEASLELLRPIDFDQPVSVGDLRFQLQPAGHLLGAGSVILEADGRRLGISGDVGRPDDVLMRPPRPLPALDALLLESTYGNRRHEANDVQADLAEAVNSTVKNGGVVLIPSFAVGRSQLMLHLLASLMQQDRIPRLPLFLDSPMAIDASDIYCRFADQHRLSRADCERFREAARFTQGVEESQALAELNYPHVIIAGSGMATGGRILHHMKRLLPDHRTTVLFTGFQAGGTRGAKLLRGDEQVRIHGQWVPVRARIVMLEGLSGHADYVNIGNWLASSELREDTQIRLVHGEPEALEAQRDFLRRQSGFDDVEVGIHHQILTV